MAAKKPGRPQGEVHAGQGFDEKLKRLGELCNERGWSFKSEQGVIDATLLARLAAEQEKDQKDDREAWSKYQQIHEPVMRRQGERGAIYSSALSFARTAARSNRELLKLLKELAIRSPGSRKGTKKDDDQEARKKVK